MKSRLGISSIMKMTKEERKSYQEEQRIIVGNRLRRLREESGMSQREVSEILGLETQAAYGKLEGGNVTLQPHHCVILAELFGKSCDYILRGVEHENADVWKETGLADRSIAFLKVHKRHDLDKIFQNGHFWHMIENVESMTDYINDPEQAERRWDVNSFLVHKCLDRLLSELRTNAIEDISYEERENVESIRNAREDATEYEFEAAFLEFMKENDL